MVCELSPKESFYYLWLKEGYPLCRVVEMRFKDLYGDCDFGEAENKRILRRLNHEAGFYAKKLVADEYLEVIKVINKKCPNPKTYKLTTRIPRLSDNITSGVSEQIYNNQNDDNNSDINVHHNVYRFKVVEKPKINIKWEKINKDLKSGVISYYLSYPCDIGNIIIRYDVCKKSDDDVYIYLPETVVTDGDRKIHEKMMQEYVFSASAFLQRILKCQLGIPMGANKKHYQVAVYQPGVLKFLETANISFKK